MLKMNYSWGEENTFSSNKIHFLLFTNIVDSVSALQGVIKNFQLQNL